MAGIDCSTVYTTTPSKSIYSRIVQRYYHYYKIRVERLSRTVSCDGCTCVTYRTLMRHVDADPAECGLYVLAVHTYRYLSTIPERALNKLLVLARI
jgi:hypothetical protein